MTSALPFRAFRSGASLARIAIAAVILTAALSVVGPVSHPARVEASTASYMEGLLVKWINDARAARGVPKLSVGTKLTDLAGDRAATMANYNKMAHPSCLGCLLNARAINWSTCGEVIAGTTYPWGSSAAKSIFNAWKGSSGHWGILMSRNFTRIGLGVAYRSSNHNTFAAGILAR